MVMNRYLLRFAVCSVFLFVSLTESSIQWKPTGGPACGSSVNALSVAYGNILAGTDNGLARSTNGGASWTVGNLSSPVYSIAMNGNLVFAGSLLGVYVSADSGKSWTVSGTGLPSENCDHHLFYAKGIGIFDGVNSHLLSSRNGIYLSTNNGVSWAKANTGISAYDTIYSFAQIGGRIFAGTCSGLYKSDNAGQTWTGVDSLQNVVYSLLVVGTSLYAGTNEGAFLSKNSGNTWTEINTGLRVAGYTKTVFSLFASGSNIFAGCKIGVYKSTNNGASWAQSDSGLPVTATKAFTSSGSVIFSGNTVGIYITNDYGVTWAATNKGLSFARITTLRMYTDGLFAGSVGAAYYSNKNVNEWAEIRNGLAPEFRVTSVEFINKTPTIGTSGGLYQMTGYVAPPVSYASWKPLGLNAPSRINDLGYIISGNLLIVSDNGVYKSNDAIHWTSFNTGLSGTSAGIYDFFENDKTLHIGTARGVFMSNSALTAWVPETVGISAERVYCLSGDDTCFFAGTYHGLYLSKNRGQSWSSTKSRDIQITAMRVLTDGIIAATPKGAFISINKGESWIADNMGLGNHALLSLWVDTDRIFAGTENAGVWWRPRSPLVDASPIIENHLVPRTTEFSFRLSEIGNSTVLLALSLPRLEKVRITACDFSGRTIFLLTDQTLGPGEHFLTRNTKKFSRGCYIINMQAGSSRISKKLFVIR